MATALARVVMTPSGAPWPLFRFMDAHHQRFLSAGGVLHDAALCDSRYCAVGYAIATMDGCHYLTLYQRYRAETRKDVLRAQICL